MHSMGGLVVRQYVIQTHDLSKTPMIYFSASPINRARSTQVPRAKEPISIQNKTLETNLRRRNFLILANLFVERTAHLVEVRYRPFEVPSVWSSTLDQARAKTTTPLAGMTTEADAGKPWVLSPFAITPAPFPATCGFTQFS